MYHASLTHRENSAESFEHWPGRSPIGTAALEPSQRGNFTSTLILYKVHDLSMVTGSTYTRSLESLPWRTASAGGE